MRTSRWFGWLIASGFTLLAAPASAQPVSCGNGTLQTLEQCDDGNLASGDGCSALCQIEPGYRCTGTLCTPVCGDGVRTPGEQCDDRNNANNDGCSSTCNVEFGYLCVDPSPNLIANGTFSLGRSGFLSEYNYNDARSFTSSAATGGGPEGNYTVTNNPDGWHEEFTRRLGGAIVWRDSDGDGWAALFNGVPNLIAYQTQLPVVAGQPYSVQIAVADWGQVNRARLYMEVDGQRVTAIVQPPSSGGFAMNWERLTGTFIAQRSANVLVRIIDLETADGGNDFALDDVVLRRSEPTSCTLLDTDNDSVPDLVEGSSNDTDRDGTPDFRDPDDDGDGIPTRAERPGNVSVDTDRDGVADYLDFDDDNDTLATISERPGGLDRDTDRDGVPDHLDNDDDNDTIPTRTERILDSTPFGPDNDGIPSYLDTDSDGDGDLDRDEAGPDPTNPVDTDRDGARDFLDTDSDNDCLLDSDLLENGANRTNAAAPSMNADANCATGQVCNTSTGTCVTPLDSDRDGLPDSVEIVIGTNPFNPDSDGDGIGDLAEVGPDRNNPVNSDGDTLIDANDPDDDNDTVPTRTERPGAPVDTDMDGAPDHLDPDDDNDTIPTAVERRLDPSDFGPDMDSLPSYRDTDSDGDGDLDRDERGPDAMNPVDTDTDGRPDFLDADSDNDCLPDSDPREDGANRTNAAAPSMNADDNCPSGQVCSRSTGVCTADLDTDRDGLPDSVEMRIGTNPNNPDSDGDGIGDLAEVGPDRNNPVNTDGDGLINANDPDDDNDTVPTREERRGWPTATPTWTARRITSTPTTTTTPSPPRWSAA
ncbi:MAG: DUF4215 domain-containing protein [Polyangiales bacterium]